MPMRHSLFWKIGFRFVVPDNKEWYKVKFHPNYMYMHCVYKKKDKSCHKGVSLFCRHSIITCCKHILYKLLLSSPNVIRYSFYVLLMSTNNNAKNCLLTINVLDNEDNIIQEFLTAFSYNMFYVYKEILPLA